jgi:hypothetical protein
MNKKRKKEGRSKEAFFARQEKPCVGLEPLNS